jgi:hypothetical protein
LATLKSHRSASKITDIDYEQKIAEKIMKNYHRRSKPQGVIEVKFSMHLNQIVTLIEKEQNIVLNVFIDHEWVDNRLTWDPKVCKLKILF